MRVLVVTNDLPPRIGGIQYYVDQLCRGLAAAGDDVTIYGSSYEGDAAWDSNAPFRVIRERTSVLLPTPLVRSRVHRLVERYDPQVVIFGAAFPLGFLGPGITKRFGVPYVAFTHGLEVSAVRAPGGRHLLRRIGSHAAAVTFVSGWCEERLAPAFGSGPIYRRLSPAVDASRYNPSVSGKEVRQRYGLGDDPVVVCVSRVVERKGQDTLIRILPELRRRVPHARLLIVGSGPFMDQIRDLATERGVNDWVTFAGKVSDEDLPAHFAAGDVFAMPCRERKGGLEVEAFGIVFIQAQAVGVPVIAGNIGGVPDSLRDGSTGLLVESTDESAVLEGVAELLGDPDRASEMGNAGAGYVEEGFTWDRRVTELRDLLGSLSR